MRWKGNLSHQRRLNHDDVSQRRFEGDNSMNAEEHLTTDELIIKINSF